MLLSRLFDDFPVPILSPISDVQVSGVTSDSRRVVSGSLFVAVPGESTDGHRYIPQAVGGGAAAVVGALPPMSLPVPYIQVEDSRRALAHLAAAFHGYPARRMTVIGVTGTDGKTTTANLIYHILLAAGLRAGLISTVNAVIGSQVVDTGFHVTTPGAEDVQQYLAQMVSAGLTHVVLEATSHGLAQNRVDACEFDVAVVTNITHEHLDYHGSYAAYLQAKARLFQMLTETAPKAQGNPRAAVLNRDDGSFSELEPLVAALEGVRMITYGESIFQPAESSITVTGVSQPAQGLLFTIHSSQGSFPIRTNLWGHYNVANCLAAFGATAVALGISPQAVQQGMMAFPGVPGRMEIINLGQDFTALVDFAHTPNALRQALKTCRQLSQGRVIAVFGSAGLRDRLKRRMMAETAAQLADLFILTAEDPRTESLDAILEEMAQGAKSQGAVEEKTFWREPDRGEALRRAVALARAGDVVIACGKGHEQSMCFGTTEYPWDDRVAMRAALAERLGIPGPAMPYLPTRDSSHSI